MNKSIVAVLLFLFCTVLPAQDKLQGLRQEIRQLETKMTRLNRQESTALNRLVDIEQQISLRKKLLRGLEAEKRRTQRRITQTQRHLAETEQAFQRRKSAMGSRMKAMYKRGRMSNWEALLSLNSFHQLTVWVKYHQRILAHDQRNLSVLRTQRDSIVTQRRRLSQSRDRQQKLINEAKQEAQRLAQQEKEQQSLVGQYKRDKQAVRQRIDQKLATLREIERQIQRQQRQPRRSGARKYSGFAKRKSKLEWPVHGRVINRFGTNRDALTGVEWDHPGIDIQAGDGDVVRVVADGEIYMVDWQRSDAFIVIVNHGDGYNTVYTHLEQVQVEPQDAVRAGDILGRVSNKNSLNGATLQFMVWKNNDTVNPMKWLKKR